MFGYFSRSFLGSVSWKWLDLPPTLNHEPATPGSLPLSFRKGPFIFKLTLFTSNMCRLQDCPMVIRTFVYSVEGNKNLMCNVSDVKANIQTAVQLYRDCCKFPFCSKLIYPFYNRFVMKNCLQMSWTNYLSAIID